MSGTPSIRISQHRRLYSPPRLSPLSTADGRAATTTAGFTAAAPMAIPRAPEAVPPPLPPPTYIPEIVNGHDPGWQWGNDPNGSDFGRAVAVKPGSSLLGGSSMLAAGHFRHEKELDHTLTASSLSSFADARRGSSVSTIVPSRDSDMTDDSISLNAGDEDSNSSRSSSSYRLHGERQLEQRTQEESSNTYDKQLLSRIGGPNGPHTPKRPSLSYPAGSGLQETAQLAQAESERRNGALRPLSMPERRANGQYSPASVRLPSSGPMSPGFATGFWATEHGPSTEPTRAQTRQGSLAYEETVSSHRGSCDQSMFNPEDFDEDGPMSNLNLQDRSPGSEDQAKAGTKRRASSPPRDTSRDERSSISSASGQSDIFQRRSVQHMPTRSPPMYKYQPQLSPLSSVSTVSSFAPRHGSLGSSIGMASIASSATSYASGRLSPGGLSPPLELDNKLNTPYAGTNALTAAPPATTPSHHQRNTSDSTQPSVPGGPAAPDSSHQHSRNTGMSCLQGVFICDCCPKKPKKFDTQEELRLHESEKQYTCSYCSNRFKNKNEAERHQNSLHLRRHSWSCAALAGVEAAYHLSSSANGTDACGFCGVEFPNPPQWDVRADHLNHTHKFGECNQTKKFFRADHFRQHLKHSHGGSSGKWTNMLENACMRDEPPLVEKRISPISVSVPGNPQPTTSLAIPSSSVPGVHHTGRVVPGETLHGT